MNTTFYGIFNGTHFLSFHPSIHECYTCIYSNPESVLDQLEIRSLKFGQNPQTDSIFVERANIVCDFSKIIKFYKLLEERSDREYIVDILKSIDQVKTKYICIDSKNDKLFLELFELIASNVTVTKNFGFLRITWTSINVPNLN